MAKGQDKRGKDKNLKPKAEKAKTPIAGATVATRADEVLGGSKKKK